MRLTWIALGGLILGLAPALSAQMFTQCPGNTFDTWIFTGCASLITANADGSFTIADDFTQPKNATAAQNDSLVGFQNNSSAPISGIRITRASVNGIGAFGFDFSGSINNIVVCPIAKPGITGYEGPGVTFTDLDSSNPNVPCDTGTVNFNPPVAPGKSAYFYLERSLNLIGPTIALASPSAPTPTVTQVTDEAGIGTSLTPGMPIQVVGSGFGTSASAAATITIASQTAVLWKYVDSSHLLVYVPVNAPLGATTLIATLNGVASTPFPITLVQFAPIILPTTANPASSFYDLANNVISTTYLAVPNMEIYLIAMGLGATNPAEVPGTITSVPSPTTTPVQVMAAGKLVTPDYAGQEVNSFSGFYQVKFKVPPDASAGPQPVTISIGNATSKAATLQVGPPVPVINAIVNAATSTAKGAAPNSFVSIYGVNFGSQDTASNVFPATSFDSISVLANSNLIPLYYVFGTSGQINLVLPADLPETGTVNVQMKNAQGSSSVFQLQMASADVGMFRILDPSNAARNNGAMLFANTAWRVMPASMAKAIGFPTCAGASATKACAQPAKVGDVIQIYLTGLGKATPNGDPNGQPLATGTVAPVNGVPLYKTVATPTVTVGGIPAKVTFSGITPGNAGLYQINIAIPSGVQPGDDVPIVVTMPNGSVDTVTLAIQG
jgi:uncharacterized protein (TIGR03437 family)